MLRFGLSITTDVAKFLCVTLKRVTIPADASSQRLALMKKLDELQQSYPQLHWELEDDDSCGRDSTEPASSMKLLLTILPAAQRWRSEGGMFSLVSCTFVLFVSVCLFVIIVTFYGSKRSEHLATHLYGLSLVGHADVLWHNDWTYHFHGITSNHPPWRYSPAEITP